MGLALGGIAAAIPRRIYGAASSDNSKLFTIGGFGATDLIYVTGVSRVPNATAQTLTVSVNDGAAKTFTLATGATTERYLGFDFYIKNGYQIGSYWVSGQAATTTAITMTGVASITVSVDTGEIHGVAITILNAP